MLDHSNLQSVLRIGWGSQSRKLAEGQPLYLGGSEIAHSHGLPGRLRGDVVCHSVIEALLSASGLPAYELMFGEEEEPDDTEPLVVLAQTVTGLYRKRLAGITNLVVKLSAHEPQLDSYRQDMMLQLASALQLNPDQVTICIEQAEDQLTDLAGGTVRSYATLGCVIKPVLKPDKRVVAPKEQSALTFEDIPEQVDEIDENLPSRAKEFEKAVRSKLPPLPKADQPAEGATLIVYTDGASRGNPGPSSTGWVVLNEQGLLVGEGGELLGEHTNNQAEYLAVQSAANWLEQNLGRHFSLQLRLDSELVVRQLNGEWKIKDKQLKQLAMEVLNLLMYFDGFEIRHVPRTENKRADALANKVLDDEKQRTGKS